MISKKGLPADIETGEVFWIMISYTNLTAMNHHQCSISERCRKVATESPQQQQILDLNHPLGKQLHMNGHLLERSCLTAYYMKIPEPITKITYFILNIYSVSASHYTLLMCHLTNYARIHLMLQNH